VLPSPSARCFAGGCTRVSWIKYATSVGKKKKSAAPTPLIGSSITPATPLLLRFQEVKTNIH
jgi:hypothetical protein